ncbi:hypothetical protein JM49_13055 [Pseudomonas chlororaphis subsp. aurantiaca]|nr:hypothetical protein JM49_13055 [Pseudomonas chlororaphis subsp. aurantiaca]
MTLSKAALNAESLIQLYFIILVPVFKTSEMPTTQCFLHERIQIHRLEVDLKPQRCLSLIGQASVVFSATV